MIQILNLLLLSHTSLSLYHFFPVTFPLLFRLGNFYCSIFKYTNCFLCYIHSSMKLIHCFLFQLQYFSSYSFLKKIPKLFLFLKKNFYFFGDILFASRVLIITHWSIFMMTALKFLPNNPNILLIWVLTSLYCLFSFKL